MRETRIAVLTTACRSRDEDRFSAVCAGPKVGPWLLRPLVRVRCAAVSKLGIDVGQGGLFETDASVARAAGRFEKGQSREGACGIA